MRRTVRFVSRNNGTFRYQRRVPKALTAAIGCEWIRVQLKAGDWRAAEKEATQLTAYWDRRFDEEKRRQENQPHIQRQLAELFSVPAARNPTMPALLQDALTRAAPLTLDPLASQGPLAVGDEHLAARAVHLDRLSDAIERQIVQADARFLSETGALAASDPTVRELRDAVRVGVAEDLRAIALLRGNAVSAPVSEAFGRLFAQWVIDFSPGKSAQTETRRSIRYFEASLAGPVSLPVLAVEHMRAYYDWLVGWRNPKTDKGLSPASIIKYYGQISTLLKVGKRLGLIARNPADEFELPKQSKTKARAAKRAVFSREQLQQIRASVLPWLQANHPRKPVRAWITLLGMTTGARRGEIALARTTAVMVRDGVWVLDLTWADTAKNIASQRYLPIPQRILDDGFLAYWQSRKGQELLFDYAGVKDLPDAFSKWFAKFAKRLGIKRGRGEVFHSFRHTMKDRLREAKADKELRDRVMGHTTGDEASDYGAGHSLQDMKDALDAAVALMLSPAAQSAAAVLPIEG